MFPRTLVPVVPKVPLLIVTKKSLLQGKRSMRTGEKKCDQLKYLFYEQFFKVEIISILLKERSQRGYLEQLVFRHKTCQLSFQVRLNREKKEGKTHAWIKLSACIRDSALTSNKGIININNKSCFIQLIFPKASPKISSKDWQNVMPILFTGKQENIRDATITAMGPYCLGAQTTWIQPVGATHLNIWYHQWKTLVFENCFESNKYRGKCLFRRREEMNLRWEQDIDSLRRKRETTTEWHWSC